MKKRILLIGYNFRPELTGIGKYSGEMMDWLGARGYECAVITAYPYYPHWRVQEPYYQHRHSYSTEHQRFASGGSVTVYRCPLYVPAAPSGLKRALLDISFLFAAALALLRRLPGPKFDLVFVVAPSFHLGLLGILYQKLRRAKLWYHVQDLQIEAARDLKLIRSPRAIEILFRLEKYILRRCDTISSLSAAMTRQLAAKAGKPIVRFPNWADTSAFYPLPDRAGLKQEFGFQPTDTVILYSGAVGEKQGLEAILYAAGNFRARPDLKFVICGSGPYRQQLQAAAQMMELPNVVFMPLQPADKLNRFLNMADVHLVIQKATAADAVMPSKLTTILAVGGLALITANPGSDLYSLVREHQIGLLVPAENQQALSEGIRRALETNNELMTENARTYAENHLSIERIMTAFEAEVNA